MPQEIEQFQSTKTIDVVVQDPDAGFVKFGNYYFRMGDVAEIAIVLDEEPGMRVLQVPAYSESDYENTRGIIFYNSQGMRSILDISKPKNKDAGKIVRNLLEGDEFAGGISVPISLQNIEEDGYSASCEGLPLPLKISKNDGRLSLGIYDFSAKGWFQLVWEVVWGGGSWLPDDFSQKPPIFAEATQTILDSDRQLYVLGREYYTF